MTIQSQLLESICGDLGIEKGTGEFDTNFTCRAVYSALGRLAYASIWDEIDTTDKKYAGDKADETPSIVHFKRRIRNSFKAFSDIFPEIIPYFSESSEMIEQTIFKQFERTGQFYRSPYRISPPVKFATNAGNITFLRGISPFEKVFASGLGVYVKSVINTDLGLSEMFNLPREKIIEYWNETVNRAAWLDFSVDDKFEFLNQNISKGSTYWVEKPIRTENCSIMRSKHSENRLYYLYKFENGKFMVSQLPDFMTQNSEYLTIANGCLSACGALPKSEYHQNGTLVALNVGYLYPTSIGNLINLYSWPVSFRNVDGRFNRVINTDVFFEIKPVLEDIGFEFLEV